MTLLHGAEIEWIVALQRFADLEQVLRISSYVAHSPMPYMMAVIYLTLSPGVGSRLYLLASLNSCLVWILKSAFHLPRPFWLDARVKVLDSSGYYGMPSGHVQAATVFWLFLARLVHSPWAWVTAGVLTSVVALARVYFGVHFFSDALGGFLAGFALLAGFWWIDARLGPRLKKFRLWQQLGAVILITLVILIVGLCAAWVCPPLEADPTRSAFRVDFGTLKPLIGQAGLFLSTACSLIAANRWASFGVTGPLWERGLRCVFAFAGIELIRYLFSLIPAPECRVLHALLAFGKAASIPFWILFLAPLILLKAEFLRIRPDNAEPETVRSTT